MIYLLVLPLVLYMQVKKYLPNWCEGRYELNLPGKAQFCSQFLYVALVSIIGGIRGKRTLPALAYTLIVMGAAYLFSSIDSIFRLIPGAILVFLPWVFLLTASIVLEVVYRKWFERRHLEA